MNDTAARWYEGDIVQINRPEYPPFSKFRRGTVEWLEGESIGVRLDANDTLEQFLIDDCTLIARGEKYHYEAKIAQQAERVRTLEAALGTLSAQVHKIRYAGDVQIDGEEIRYGLHCEWSQVRITALMAVGTLATIEAAAALAANADAGNGGA